MQKANAAAMGEKPIFPLLLSMAIPPTISMLIQALYNVVDSIFVNRLSESAFTAVSLVYPLQNLIIALGVGFGVSLNAAIARSLGAKDYDRASQVATHSLILTGVHSLLFLFIGLFLTDPFLSLFPADAAVYEMAAQYSRIVVCCAFGTLFHLCVEKMFQASGNMIIPMAVQALGAIINIILDPILIFGMFGLPQMGVSGAAIATVIGQATACLVSILLFVKQNTVFSFRLRKFSFDKSTVLQLYAVAIPSTVMFSLPSVLVALLNKTLAVISAAAVNVLGIYFKLQSFVYMPANGIIQGMRPIVSYNYGAGNRDRMHQAIFCSLRTAGGIMAAGTLLFLLFPSALLAPFDVQEEVASIAVTALRLISLGFLVSTVGIVFAGTFEALGKGPQSLCISLVRQLLITPALAYVLSKTALGLIGVWICFPIAETCAALVAIIIYRRTMGQLYASPSSPPPQPPQ